MDATLALALFAALAALLVLVRRSRTRGRTITPYRLIAAARGRTIVVGENHADRGARDEIMRLVRVAHENGYRTLGVEVCEESVDEHSGFLEETAFLSSLGDAELTEHDARSSLDAGPDGLLPRMNRHWQVREALRLGWRVVPIDPHHWNWREGTAVGYLESREPAMAEKIRAHHPMIAVCGYGHLGGLRRLLGDDAVYAVACEVRRRDAGREDFWSARIAAAARLPRLRAAGNGSRSS